MYLNPDLQFELARQLLAERRRDATNRRTVAAARRWNRRSVRAAGPPPSRREAMGCPSDLVGVVTELGHIADGRSFTPGGLGDVALRRLVVELRDVASRRRVDVRFADGCENDPAVVLLRIAARLASSSRDEVVLGAVERRRLRRRLAELRRAVGPPPPSGQPAAIVPVPSVDGGRVAAARDAA